MSVQEIQGIHPKQRPDFVNSLVHLTRKRIGKPHFIPADLSDRNETSAFDVLKEILTEGIVVGSNYKGFIKGNTNAVCFSEIPLSGLRYYTSGEKARYSIYGIVIRKGVAFKLGARPVIYLPNEEVGWVPKEELWRHVRFEPPSIDYTDEREWRLKGHLKLKDLDGFYVLVRNPSEAKQIESLYKGDNLRGILPMGHLTQMF